MAVDLGEDTLPTLRVTPSTFSSVIAPCSVGDANEDIRLGLESGGPTFLRADRNESTTAADHSGVLNLCMRGTKPNINVCVGKIRKEYVP